MWPLVTALANAALAFSSVADAEPPGLAINPNISIGSCNGGRPIDVRSGMSAQTYTGTLRGEIPGEEAFGVYCTGYYVVEPHFCFVVPSSGAYLSFEITEGGGIDTTLAIANEDLEWPICDDDGGQGLLSRVNQWFEGGEYTVHLGSYGQHNSASFTLTVQAGDVW